MELADLVNMVPNFVDLAQGERAKLFGWHLHVYGGKERFSTSDIRHCYEALHLEPPNVADVLAKLAAKKPPVLLRSGNLYKLERRVRQELDTKYGNRPVSIAVEQSLAALPVRLTDETKRKYLVEALNCYRAKCFRAAILMTWNLAYDHLLNWVLADASRMAKFNTRLPNKPPFSTGLFISKREDFEWLGEREVVDICGHRAVAIISDNLKKMLLQNLDRRNTSAHPSAMEISQVNAEDTISSLVENVVLHLT